MSETNFQHYSDYMKIIVAENETLALRNGEPCICNGQCAYCGFSHLKTGCGICEENRRAWLNSEYKAPKPKLTIADHHLVNILKNGYIARDYDGELYFYEKKPVKQSSSPQWGGSWCYRLDRSDLVAVHDFLTFIRWEDEKPWSVEDLLKLEVEQ